MNHGPKRPAEISAVSPKKGSDVMCAKNDASKRQKKQNKKNRMFSNPVHNLPALLAEMIYQNFKVAHNKRQPPTKKAAEHEYGGQN